MAEMIETINPTTGDLIERYRSMDWAAVEQAIQACSLSQRDWQTRTLAQRAQAIRAIGSVMEKHRRELAELMTREMGKPLEQGLEEVDLCVQICNHTAEMGPSYLVPEDRELGDGQFGRIFYSPLGVIYGIQPWNFPAYQVVRFTMATLMAGNGVLLKHAPNVTGSAKMLEHLFLEAQLPQNLFQVLVIDHDTSDQVIEHALVRGVTFTGSASGGSVVASKAAKALKKTVMELGSNDAYVVLEDADVAEAAEQCVLGRVYNNGETCVAAKRFIVVDKVYDKFREAALAAMKRQKLGDPMDPDVTIGPMARADLRDKLHKQVTESLEKGAKALCGAELPKGKGYFYPATLLENVKPGQPAYDDELFGPVASLIRARDEDDAMRIANDSVYGLGGAIFSRDEQRAMGLAAERFDTGMVNINGFGVAHPAMPFGGTKQSGWGREHGGFGIREFVNVKAVIKR